MPKLKSQNHLQVVEETKMPTLEKTRCSAGNKNKNKNKKAIHNQTPRGMKLASFHQFCLCPQSMGYTTS